MISKKKKDSFHNIILSILPKNRGWVATSGFLPIIITFRQSTLVIRHS